MAELALRFHISRLVIMRRALDLGLVDHATYQQHYQAELAAFRDKPGGGGSFYRNASVKNSKRFAHGCAGRSWSMSAAPPLTKQTTAGLWVTKLMNARQHIHRVAVHLGVKIRIYRQKTAGVFQLNQECLTHVDVGLLIPRISSDISACTSGLK